MGKVKNMQHQIGNLSKEMKTTRIKQILEVKNTVNRCKEYLKQLIRQLTNWRKESVNLVINQEKYVSQ